MIPGRDRGQSLLVAAAVAAAALACVAGIAVVAGLDVVSAAEAAVRGSVGSWYSVLSATLKRATPFLLLGIAVAVAFRAGVLNIGAEGQLLAGATAAVAVGLSMPPGAPALLIVPLELAAGIGAGAAWGLIAAVLLRRFRVSEVVSTLLLNFVAVNLVGALIRGPMQEPTGAYPQSAMLPAAAQLPKLIEGHQLHLGFLLAVGVAAFASWYFRRTASGFRLTVSGVNPSVAATAGLVAVDRVRFRALVASAAIAGLAGASEATGVTMTLYEGLSPGYGYTAIGVALLGGLAPGGIAAAAVVFGALGAGADAMQRDAGVPPEMAIVLAALVILGMLAAPAAVRRFAVATPPRSAP